MISINYQISSRIPGNCSSSFPIAPMKNRSKRQTTARSNKTANINGQAGRWKGRKGIRVQSHRESRMHWVFGTQSKYSDYLVWSYWSLTSVHRKWKRTDDWVNICWPVAWICCAHSDGLRPLNLPLSERDTVTRQWLRTQTVQYLSHSYAKIFW